MKRYWKLIVVCGIVFSTWANLALAQGKGKLSLGVADSLPTGKHWLVDNGIKPWGGGDSDYGRSGNLRILSVGTVG